jgi:hypothetical protein
LSKTLDSIPLLKKKAGVGSPNFRVARAANHSAGIGSEDSGDKPPLLLSGEN